MLAYLCLSIIYLDESFHGRRDGGEPEWPPSPLRLFQALVAASEASRRAGRFADTPGEALRWLERQPAPCIIAPRHAVGTPVRLAVPNNDLDVVASYWAKGQEPKKQPSELKTLKPVRPTRLRGGDRVYYLYPLTGESRGCAETICDAARSITHLGWGVDMVAGHGRILTDVETAALLSRSENEVWRPDDGCSPDALRVPRAGTLDDLNLRYRAFLDRLSHDGYTPVPPLTQYDLRGYRRASDIAPSPFAAFEIWKPIHELAELRAGQTKSRPFDPVRSGVVVAAMVRRATATAAMASGWPDHRIASFVHGHAAGGGPAKGADADQRFAFLPLPSITPLKVESIRRVLVVAPPGAGGEVAWARQALSGQQLFAEGKEEPVAMLSVLAGNDPEVLKYVHRSEVWSTVTPVVLPGQFSRGVGRTTRLLRHAFEQAGWPTELFDRAELEWREVGFRPGVDVARRYHVPDQLARLARVHVRMRWPVEVPGPMAVGAGRYRGLGVFAAEHRQGKNGREGGRGRAEGR